MNGREKSDPAIVAVKPTNKAGQPAAEPVEPRAGAEGNADQQSTHRTQIRARVTQALDRVRQAARQRKKERFTALLHHVNPDTLRLAFYALKRKAAPGVDGVRWADYEAELEPRLADLHGRIHRGAYRPQPARRVYIPKRADGRQRPPRDKPVGRRLTAIAALEDKIVQGAVVMVLNAIYEEDFLGLSSGVPIGTWLAHDALDALYGRDRPHGKVNWIPGRRHPVVLRHGQPGLAGPFRGTPDRRQAHRPPDPEMAAGRNTRTRGGDGRWRTRSRFGDLAAACQHLPALRLLDLWANRWRQHEATGDMISCVLHADERVTRALSTRPMPVGSST